MRHLPAEALTHIAHAADEPFELVPMPPSEPEPTFATVHELKAAFLRQKG